MPPQQLKISGKHIFLYLSSLKEHLRIFIIIIRSKLQELCGIEVPPLSIGAKTYFPLSVTVPNHFPEDSALTGGSSQ
jgi:hypothetical protein